jgi:indole-3-glycerol phosphate synthase
LTDEARARAATLRKNFSEIEAAARSAGTAPSLKGALSRNDVGVIAEVKRSSPSKGAINEGLDIGEQVSRYQAGGAAAISILTEQTRFGGSNDDLVQARRYVTLPLLKKDFHVDVVQIYEARALGAAAALVIARAVEPSLLGELVSAGSNCGIEILVEVRDERELARAIAANAALIGVNNRNLETLEIDPETCARMLPLIPASVVAVAESGIASADDVERLAAYGADAVLVGSVLSASNNPEAAVRALTGVPRSHGARKG